MNNFDDAAMAEILRNAVAEFQHATGFPITFGGFHTQGVATVTEMAGNHTPNLQGLKVANERGLGGRAMAEVRPRFTGNYKNSPHITHDYDGPILSEGITSLLAFPVVVDGMIRAVLYGGGRGGATPGASSVPGNSFLVSSGAVVQSFAREIETQEEVQRRVRATLLATPHIPGSVLETLRQHQAELRGIANDVDDATIRDRLAALERRIAQLSGTEPKDSQKRFSGVQLSPREIDVLAQAALGHQNAAIGVALGLTESTVKSYMKTTMSKLGASSRFEAVALARQAGFIL